MVGTSGKTDEASCVSNLFKSKTDVHLPLTEAEFIVHDQAILFFKRILRRFNIPLLQHCCTCDGQLKKGSKSMQQNQRYKASFTNSVYAQICA